MDQKHGLEAARAAADKIRTENTEAEEKKEVAMEQAKNALAAVRENATLASMYDSKSREEMSDSLGALPLLKLHTTGRSHNQLIDGTQPEDGSFFYVPTQEAFKNPDIHILKISEGFYAEGLPDDNGKTKIGYNILLGGVINVDRPFLMFVTSNAIRQSLWEFRNELNKYARLMKVPKLALTVNMASGKVPNTNPQWAKINPMVNNITFTIEKLPDGTPAKLVADEGEFVALVDMQEMLKEMIDSVIATKRVEKPIPVATEQEASQAVERSEESVVDAELSEDIADDIPF